MWAFSGFLMAHASPTNGVTVLPTVEIVTPQGSESGPASVVGGVEAPVGNDDVVALALEDPRTGELTVFCTGSVIQDDWVLTAAHCIEESEEAETELGFARVVAWGEDLPRLGATEVIRWSRARISPDYSADQLEGDVGLVQLVSPHPSPTWVVLRDESFDRALVGTTIDVFGFGSTGDLRNDAGIKRTTTLMIQDVDDANIRTFTPGTNLCGGDSGGPGFVATADGREQVGINAFVTPGCIGGRAGSTRVDQHIDWILDHVPGVALDASQLPDRDSWVDADDPRGPVGEVEDQGLFRSGGCQLSPVGMGGAMSWLLVVVVRRRRRSSPSETAIPSAQAAPSLPTRQAGGP